MAFFKFRKGGEENPTPPPAAESIEAMRRRAKHRLIGAAVLVLAGVLGFPLVFDNQPRPIAVDIPIEIPDKLKAKPLAQAPAPAATPAPAAKVAGMIEEGPETAPAEAKPQAKPPVKVEAKPEPKVEAKVEAKPEPKPEPKIEPKTEEPEKKTDLVVGRFVVQVGAFTDPVKVREARLKLERAGLKTYTQVIESKEGKRIRVRVGPFETKADADKVAEKIRKLDLQAGILEL